MEEAILDPILLASTPHRSLTAFQDLCGELAKAHLAIRDGAQALGATAYAILPLGDGRGESEWLQAVQHQHELAARALGVEAPPDLSSYDLSRREDWDAWVFLLAEDLRRLRDAAGVI